MRAAELANSAREALAELERLATPAKSVELPPMPFSIETLKRSVLNWLPNELQVHDDNRSSLVASRDALDKLVSLASLPRTLKVYTTAPPVPLPPAESCAHAVARFREALELLAKRHEVSVEVGHIEPGSCSGGVEDVPDPAEIDQEYRLQFEGAIREHKAMETIGGWCEKGARFFEYRIVKPPDRQHKHAVVLSERSGTAAGADSGVRAVTLRSKSLRGATRLEALEAAARWCIGHSFSG